MQDVFVRVVIKETRWVSGVDYFVAGVIDNLNLPFTAMCVAVFCK
jgi:hypothetical protein